MGILEWLKGLFKSPKSFIKVIVDSLDLAVPYMAAEIEKVKVKFNDMNSVEKSQLVVDKIQEYLRKTFKLDV